MPTWLNYLGLAIPRCHISASYMFRPFLFCNYFHCLFQIAASLLLFMEEEDAFWMMCTIIEDLLPASYFSTTLIGVQVCYTHRSLVQPSPTSLDLSGRQVADCLCLLQQNFFIEPLAVPATAIHVCLDRRLVVQAG